MSEKLLKRIVGLFRLGDKKSGTTEAEMLAAITKAKQLMMQYSINPDDVQRAMDAQTDKEKKPHYDINRYSSYTRKIHRLAVYDELVASCVGTLTTTNPVIRYRRNILNEVWVSVEFVGTEVDIRVADALFMVLLKSVRARARDEYGGGNTWNKKHTSYATGFAHRMCNRAQEMVQATPTEVETMALVVRGKSDAISTYIAKNYELTKSKERKSQFDAQAYMRGWIHGGNISLDKRGLDGT